jgi:type II secretory pathway pseudopilin PulG
MFTAKSRTGKRGRGLGARRGEGGFTILETVIALFVMLIVGLGAVSFFLYSTNFNAGASDRARALAIAQQKIEALRAADYTTLGTLAAGASYNGTVTAGDSSSGAADQRSFTVVTTVTDDPNVSNSRQKILTVTVTPAFAGRWTGGSVTLRSARSKNEAGTN